MFKTRSAYSGRLPLVEADQRTEASRYTIGPCPPPTRSGRLPVVVAQQSADALAAHDRAGARDTGWWRDEPPIEALEMLDFYARYGITADVETLAIQDINTAFERVAKSDVRSRFVIDLDLASLANDDRR